VLQVDVLECVRLRMDVLAGWRGGWAEAERTRSTKGKQHGFDAELAKVWVRAAPLSLRLAPRQVPSDLNGLEEGGASVEHREPIMDRPWTGPRTRPFIFRVTIRIPRHCANP
jgi:hypothetical protein